MDKVDDVFSMMCRGSRERSAMHLSDRTTFAEMVQVLDD
jgi:hypothetical protein